MGSEMCIRDRTRTTNPAFGRCETQNPMINHGVLCFQRRRRCPLCRSEPARDKPENASGHQPTSVIVDDHRERARSHMGDVQGTKKPMINHGFFCGFSAGFYAGAEVRIRWSKALREALAPSPTAITICLYGTVVTSPAANTPGTEVSPRASTMISPRGDNLSLIHI